MLEAEDNILASGPACPRELNITIWFWWTQAVRFLLDYVDRRQVYQALLAAINIGNEDIAETIVEHPKYDEISDELSISKRRGGFQHGTRFNDDSNQFSEEITPLILASQQNRFEVCNNITTAWVSLSYSVTRKPSCRRGATIRFPLDTYYCSSTYSVRNITHAYCTGTVKVINIFQYIN